MKRLKIRFVDWPSTGELNTLGYGSNSFLEIIEEKYEVEISENPDYLFYSDFGKEHLKYDCIRIYYTPENLVPDFNICDYAIGFHHLKFEDRYLRFPIYGLFKYKSDYERAIRKHQEIDINPKTRFCNFIYSNGNADAQREKFFNYLNRYKKVDSGGKYKNNIGSLVVDKFIFQQNYKFSIAFENSRMSGYTTEKIIQAFAAQTIPIYWGDPSIGQFFNEKAFINIQSYGSFDEVLERIIEIDNNPDLFFEILKEPMLKIKDIDYSDLSSFLYNIFERDKDDYRRSNILRGKWYQDWQKKMVKVDRQLSRIERYLPFIKLV